MEEDGQVSMEAKTRDLETAVMKHYKILTTPDAQREAWKGFFLSFLFLRRNQSTNILILEL